MSRLTALILICIPMLLALLVACGAGSRNSAPAPDFEVTLYDGSDFLLSAEAGKSAVVLNFWYPSCPPCREEMPDFERAWQQLQGEDVRFLGLFVPRGLDSEQDARDFIDELGLTYDFATDQGARIINDYQIRLFPTTYFIDKSGRVFKIEFGPVNADQIVRHVRDMSQS